MQDSYDSTCKICIMSDECIQIPAVYHQSYLCLCCADDEVIHVPKQFDSLLI